MKYLCLMYYPESTLDAFSSSEFEALMKENRAHLDEMREKGQFLGANKLQPVRTATTVRVRDGKLSATDGPFAETKEQLGGYLLFEAHDLNEAIRLAARFPPARLGSVEIRPVDEFALD